MFKTLEDAKAAGYTHALYSLVPGFKIYVHSLWTSKDLATNAQLNMREPALWKYKPLKLGTVNHLIGEEFELTL